MHEVIILCTIELELSKLPQEPEATNPFSHVFLCSDTDDWRSNEEWKDYHTKDEDNTEGHHDNANDNDVHNDHADNDEDDYDENVYEARGGAYRETGNDHWEDHDSWRTDDKEKHHDHGIDHQAWKTGHGEGHGKNDKENDWAYWGDLETDNARGKDGIIDIEKRDFRAIDESANDYGEDNTGEGGGEWRYQLHGLHSSSNQK